MSSAAKRGVGRRLDGAHRVDAADARKAPDDAALAGGRERVLEVDAGVRDTHRHVTRVEVAIGQFGEARRRAGGRAFDQISLERLHAGRLREWGIIVSNRAGRVRCAASAPATRRLS
jgi:hypothetical protein